MSAIDAAAAVLASPPIIMQFGPTPSSTPTPAGVNGSFADVLKRGVDEIARKLDTADDMVRRLALGEDLPVHQVSYALEEARLSVEMAMQVRGRLLDGYRELMNMQL